MKPSTINNTDDFCKDIKEDVKKKDMADQNMMKEEEKDHCLKEKNNEGKEGRLKKLRNLQHV